jgi:GIY-YIG catalytic domain-containing protein
MVSVLQQLTRPSRLWSRAEVLIRPSPAPAEPGIYAWYFRELPGCVDAADCVRNGDSTLLYIGISPAAPPKNGKAPSRRTLRSRIRSHFKADASRSTLRMTLGCLLARQLGIELRVGRGDRINFVAGERAIDAWMDRCALVCWAECAEPWKVEEEAISSISLPLNLDQNSHHRFYAKLSRIRSEARQRAKHLTQLMD